MIEFFVSLLGENWGQKILGIIIGYAIVLALAAIIAIQGASFVRAGDMQSISDKMLSAKEQNDLKITAVCDKLDIQVDRIISRLDRLETYISKRIDKLEDAKLKAD